MRRISLPPDKNNMIFLLHDGSALKANDTATQGLYYIFCNVRPLLTSTTTLNVYKYVPDPHQGDRL